MATPRSLSPAARSRLRRGYLAGGVGLGLVWLGITIAIGVQGGAAVAGGAQILLLIFSAPAATLAALGILGERAARTFDAADAALADAITASLQELRQTPPTAAYADEKAVELRSVRLLGRERPLGPLTLDAVAAGMAERLGEFGPAVAAASGSQPSGVAAGLSRLTPAVSGLTRDHVRDEAEAAVVEAAGPAGARDTYRVVGLPEAAAQSWMRDLLGAAATHLGGSTTHAGDAVLDAAGDLVAHFRPADPAAFTAGWPGEDAPPDPPPGDAVGVRGRRAGRDVLVATSARIGDAERLGLPGGFPVLLGRALAAAAHAVERDR